MAMARLARRAGRWVGGWVGCRRGEEQIIEHDYECASGLSKNIFRTEWETQCAVKLSAFFIFVFSFVLFIGFALSTSKTHPSHICRRLYRTVRCGIGTIYVVYGTGAGGVGVPHSGEIECKLRAPPVCVCA